MKRTTQDDLPGPCSPTNPPPCYIEGDLPPSHYAAPVPTLEPIACAMLAVVLIGAAVWRLRGKK